MGGYGWGIHFSIKCNEVMGNDMRFTIGIFHRLHRTGSRNESQYIYSTRYPAIRTRKNPISVLFDSSRKFYM